MIQLTELIKNIEIVDQNPIGRSSRSNPVTYTKAYDAIRKFYSKEAIDNGDNLTPADFSFNALLGRLCSLHFPCQGIAYRSD